MPNYITFTSSFQIIPYCKLSSKKLFNIVCLLFLQKFKKMGGKFRRKKQSTQKVVQQSRKQLRKEKRLGKKVKKNEYFQNRNKLHEIGTSKKSSDNNNELSDKVKKSKAVKQLGPVAHDSSGDELDVKSPKIVDVLVEQRKQREKETKLKLKFQKQMGMQRKKQLKEANREEDKVIKKLEKQLKLNKRKTKSIPKSFVDEGLDCILFLLKKKILFIS